MASKKTEAYRKSQLTTAQEVLEKATERLNILKHNVNHKRLQLEEAEEEFKENEIFIKVHERFMKE